MTPTELYGVLFAAIIGGALVLASILAFLRGADDDPAAQASEPTATPRRPVRRYLRGTCPHCGETDVILRADGEPAERWHPFHAGRAASAIAVAPPDNAPADRWASVTPEVR